MTDILNFSLFLDVSAGGVSPRQALNSSNTQRLKPAALGERGSGRRRWEQGERKEEEEEKTVKEGRKQRVGLRW